MAFDATLAERIRRVLAPRSGITEKRMFGGLAFLDRGHMAVGLLQADLMVRVGPVAHAAALRLPGARPMDLTGRPLRGFLFVGPAGTRTPAALKAWLARGLAFTATLPSKAGSPRPAPRAQARRKGG